MNREIKFRAWDGKKIWTVETWEELQSKELNIMQFTGLHDRLGHEIWEGDIFTAYGETFLIHIDTLHGLRTRWGNGDMCKNYADKGEVIGNIYEHSHLLNPEDRLIREGVEECKKLIKEG